MGKYWVTIGGKRKRTQAGIKHELEKFQSSSKAKSERAARNSARRSALKKGTVHRGDNLDIHHSKGINSKKGLQAIPASENRGKREKSRRRGSKRSRRA